MGRDDESHVHIPGTKTPMGIRVMRVLEFGKLCGARLWEKSGKKVMM